MRKSKNRIGESNIANNGQVMTIIEYKNYKDIDIQFEDGTIVKNKNYNRFLKGYIKNPNLSNTNIKSRIGETNINKNRQTMTIVEYRRNNDINIQFEDGFIVKHRNYQNFLKGNIKKSNLSIKNKIGETRIAKNGQTMTIIKYRNSKDIDIQFEDGTIVKNKRYSNFKNGRIRNSNLSNIRIKNRIGETNVAHNGQIMTIITYRNANDIDIQFEDGTIFKNKSYYNFLKGTINKQNININKTGETKQAKNGQIMTIIKYRRCDDIDVQFEDGTIIKNRNYSAFKKGEIKNPNYIISGVSYNELFCLEQLKQFGFIKMEKGKLKHLGLGKRELDLYNPELKIGIEYDGGAYTKRFKHHTIKKDIEKDLLCEQAGIILYRIRESKLSRYNSSSIKFYLEDNSQGSQNLIDILKLIIKDINERFNIKFSYKYKKKKVEFKNIYKKRKNEVNIATNGQTMTIIKYRNAKDIDIQFEDGTIVKNKTYNNFKLGNIKNPNLQNTKKNRNYSAFKKEEIKNPNYKNRIGETNTANNGQVMTIIEYHKCDDIDVIFEDGTIIKNREYNAFKKGEIKNPNYNNKLIYNKRKGEINIANNNQKMTIIEYRNANDIDIQFEDGTIVKNKTYDCFKKGNIKNPNLQNIKIINRESETNIAINGQVMTIIKYRNNVNIDIQFEDGTIVRNKSYQYFKKGKIRNPNYKKK